MNYFFRHPVECVTNPRKAYATTKAMKAYRLAHPSCAFCGWSKGSVHVHHRVPIRYAPQLADSAINFISLCPKCHFIVGHARNWKQYTNVSWLCNKVEVYGDQKTTKSSS